MRLTLQKYEKAKKSVEEAKVHLRIIKTWDEAVKKIGSVGNQRIVAIAIKDGKITTECELDETADKPILKAAEK